MQNKSLADIDQSLVDTGDFLRELISDRNKLECLQTFAQCLTVVEWIRKETKGVNQFASLLLKFGMSHFICFAFCLDVSDLQNFVNVALATAVGGEGDLAHDKLSNLRTIGSHFRPLIYDLKRTADFKTLAAGCKLVWEAMERTSSLPRLLVRNPRHKEYFDFRYFLILLVN